MGNRLVETIWFLFGILAMAIGIWTCYNIGWLIVFAVGGGILMISTGMLLMFIVLYKPPQFDDDD